MVQREGRVMDEVKAAREFARMKHEGQFRRDGVTPYFDHVEDVARRVRGDELKAIAYLHDVLEDTKTTRQDLEDWGFSDHVVRTVSLLSKWEDVSYEDYISILRRSDLAKTVKIADILSNLSDDPTANQVKKYAKALEILLA